MEDIDVNKTHRQEESKATGGDHNLYQAEQSRMMSHNNIRKRMSLYAIHDKFEGWSSGEQVDIPDECTF